MILLYSAAATIGLVHTLTGPDHYLPFIAMSRARGWSVRRTMLITALCGVGHVLSSVALGVLGIALGVAVFKLESIEAIRGDLAGWLLLTFGVLYFIWGLRQAFKAHAAAHLEHGGGNARQDDHHDHRHDSHSQEEADHDHGHSHIFFRHSHACSMKSTVEAEQGRPDANITPWILFTIFLFGPCEPLIPLLMYPAAEGSWLHVAGVTAVFGVFTVGTMLAVVAAATLGLGRLRASRLGRYSHALAGFIIALCGAAVTLGL
ncbi:MAG: hypothetical protein Kow0059_22800 [Candidatus Sumerlaeia bacterium]